jgi:hypothetical protein
VGDRLIMVKRFTCRMVTMIGTAGKEGDYLCVSTHATWNGVDSPETTKWKFVLPGQLT